MRSCLDRTIWLACAGDNNMAALDSITISGFKSIRKLSNFKLGKLNLMIGANGAGKKQSGGLF
jgi:ABC-type uncharacterized transport system ATPase subunit